MSDAISGRNRLDEEASPYLQQHAGNPVHWQPWDEAALNEARERDVPIFLSVGYAACHWCHVMEEESFEDKAVASVLNEHYVPIKVDREERPDVDSIYQTICQLVTRSGGWPLSVWLTPDGRPFYVGTYFPKESGHGRPGFLELIEGLAETWEHDREEIEERAEQWMGAIKGEVEEVSDPGDLPEKELLENAATAALRSADRAHGGFGEDGPKFPQSTRIDLLLRAFDRTGRESFREVALEALDAMAAGGIYDHVGGGFHRYATDPAWGVPHFEKMLYDNAEIPRNYLAAYQLTGRERYADIVRETLAFVERELTHPEGGFFSTLDAQSQTATGGAEEGAFYVWTPEEVREAVEDETAAELFLRRFGITESGNFEGSTVLNVTEGFDELAKEFELSREEIEAELETARAALFDVRSERSRPMRDEKVLAGWNGLMLSTFAEASLVVNRGYATPASHALDFLSRHLWDGERLHRRFKDGDVKVPGYLEDYAFLARGALDLYQATGDVESLAFSLQLANALVEEFWDEETGALYFTPESGEQLVARPQELMDQSTPSSAGVAVDVLLSLSHFSTDDTLRAVAERALETYVARIESNPLQHASLALAADRQATGSRELTVVADSLPDEWRARIGETYLPTRLLSLRPPVLDEWLSQLGLDEVPPIWAGRGGAGEPTVYACRDYACSPPVTDIDDALAWFDD